VIGSLFALLVACGEPPTEPPETITPKTGQTEFTTVEQGGSGYGSTDDSRENAPQAGGGMGAAPNADTSSKAPSPEPPSGRTGTVEEADLYRVSGTTLFYLNTYKGLTIFDLSDAKKPKKLSNLPVFGYPIEMFVEGNTAYALVKDALYLLKVNGKFEFHRRHVSQLVTIDISNPNKPTVLQRLDIKGQLREGVSRKIDNTIYVVSYSPRSYWYGWSWEPHDQTPEQATVYSFNTKNPKDIKMIEKLDLIQHPAAGSTTNTNSRESRSFTGVTISATSNALLVGEKWRYYKYSDYVPGQCSTYENYQETVMSIVNISDPSGKISVHTRFKIRGELGDQFKQTYIYEKDKKRGIYLGIFRRQEWKRNNCNSERLVRNTLVSIDVSNGSNPTVLDEKVFGKPNETVRGSIFDRDRSVAYAITAVQTDPLYAISFKNPEKLEILSEVDGLSGDINVFRKIGGGDFLIAVGRDNSSACTGFGSDRVGTKMAVSIIDVRDLKKVRLVQRKCVAIEGGKWSSSGINWNLDQAHKMLGMYSKGNTNIITLPVSYYVQSNRGNRWYWYEYKSAIGIMKWDLSKYDDTKDETQQNVLENVATMQHPKGAVKRTIVTDLKQNGVDKRVVINLSDTHMSLIDLDDLRAPKPLSTYEIAPYVRSVYRFGKYILERVTLGTNSYYNDYNEFRIKELGKGDINDAAIRSSFVVGRLQRVVRWGNYVLFFRYHLDVAKTKQNKRPYYDSSKSDLLIYDFSNPLQPKERGAVTIPYGFIPHYYFFCGLGYYYDFGYYFYQRTSFIQTDRGMVSLLQRYDNASRSYTNKLMFLDLSNPDKPQVKEKVLQTFSSGKAPGRYYFNLVKLDGKQFYVVNRTQLRVYQSNNSSFTVSRYFAQRWKWDGTQWKDGKHINLPGRLVKAFRAGNKVRFLSQDYRYQHHPYTNNGRTYYRYQTISRLYLLEESGDRARLTDFKVFKSWSLRNMIVSGDNLYFSARRDWYYLYQNPKSNIDKGDFLLIYNIKNGTLNKQFASATRTYNMQLMGVQKNKLFINLPGEGLLIADTTKANSPRGLHFERTLGWTSHVEFDGDYAFAASGHFGIYQINLTRSTIPPM
jgi:hypothetical protein